MSQLSKAELPGFMASIADHRYSRFDYIPGVVEAKRLLRTHWIESELASKLDSTTLMLHYEMFLEHIIDCLSAQNPSLALRQAMVSVVDHLAKYLVVIMPPRPELDPLNLRDADGLITGELLIHGAAIAKAYDAIPNWTLFSKTPDTNKQAEALFCGNALRWDAAYKVHSELSALFESTASIREHHHIWLRLACVQWELTHREVLGMPQKLGAEQLDRKLKLINGFFSSVGHRVNHPR